MRPGEPSRRTVRRRLGGGPVDSRWWYWVAAIPATFALWTVGVSWVAVAIAAGPFGGPSSIGRSAELSLVVFGVPFLVLLVVFPFAVYADASEILAANVDWQPPRSPLVGGAAVGPLLVAAAGAYDLLGDGSLDVPGRVAVAGFLLAVPVASYYLYRRHVRLGVP